MFLLNLFFSIRPLGDSLVSGRGKKEAASSGKKLIIALLCSRVVTIKLSYGVSNFIFFAKYMVYQLKIYNVCS